MRGRAAADHALDSAEGRQSTLSKEAAGIITPSVTSTAGTPTAVAAVGDRDPSPTRRESYRRSFFMVLISADWLVMMESAICLAGS
ncbi:hypothetical protein Misp03_82770 [Microbispora sp. NBRC 16548]|nr:hypothetical protein Misp03_82770 [Microbispora sp. NBRC 16548]